MSIENTIAAHTAVMQANTAAITALSETWAKLLKQAKNIAYDVATGDVPTVTAGTVVIEVAQPPKSAPTLTAPVTATPTPEATALVEVAAASPSEPVKVEMKDLSAAVTAAATRNRDGLVAILGKHNVKRASELPQDKWAALITELEAL